MDIDWTHELVEQLEFHWGQVLRPRLDGLTDEQYLWEPDLALIRPPVRATERQRGSGPERPAWPGNAVWWSIRPRTDATSAMAVGAGDAVMDYAMPEPDPPPLTTIAWRMGHIAIGIFGTRAANHFGDGGVDYPTTDWPLTAKGGVELLDRHHDAWIDGVRALDEAGLAEPCGPAEGPFADYPMAALVLHINREALHHGAEIALMLDMYTHIGGSR